MTYTIIRPGGLKNEAGTGQGVLTEDNTVCGAIHREDVADLIVKALFSKETDGKVSCLHVSSDPSIDSLFTNLLLEGRLTSITP